MKHDVVQRPVRPTLSESMKTAFGGFYRVASSGAIGWVFGIVLALLPWAFPSPGARRLVGIAAGTVLVVLAAVGIRGLTVYLRSWLDYIASLEARAAALRDVVLRASGIDPGLFEERSVPMAIRGIQELDGGVALVIDVAPGIGPGATFTVADNATGGMWGTVQVVQSMGGVLLAPPVDRTQPEFWEELEDRMKRDPGPPPGFELQLSLDPLVTAMTDELAARKEPANG